MLFKIKRRKQKSYKHLEKYGFERDRAIRHSTQKPNEKKCHSGKAVTGERRLNVAGSACTPVICN